MIKNSKLHNLFKLSSKVMVIVPATKDINQEIDNISYVDDIVTLLSKCFGGATATKTVGYWESPTTGLVKEKSTTVFSYCSEADLVAHVDDVVEKCMQIKGDLKQDAIALEINGEMYFI